jgi:hypothetical protein
MVYRSILCARRHDPVFTRNFGPADQFGEVQVFAAVPQPGDEGSWLPFDAVPPERMRFLVGTYRRTLWLLDGTGRARRLAGMEGDWGYVQAVYFRRGEAILSFSQGGMQRASLAELSAPWEEEPEKPVRLRRVPGLGPAECPLTFSALPRGEDLPRGFAGELPLGGSGGRGAGARGAPAGHPGPALVRGGRPGRL